VAPGAGRRRGTAPTRRRLGLHLEQRDPLAGGAGALRFDATGEIDGAYRILTGTSQNCAGGPTPWGTWLSCEEHPFGQVHECDITGTSPGVVKPALGMFAHEAVTVDPGRGQLYLTEDTRDGRFYRFTPDAYPSLSSGLLEVLFADPAGSVSRQPALAPDQPQSLNRLAGAKVFNGGEGVWFDSDHVYFTTKGDDRVWDLDIATQRLSVCTTRLLPAPTRRSPASTISWSPAPATSSSARTEATSRSS